MVYFDKHGVAFFHIPKTAGTSITQLMKKVFVDCPHKYVNSKRLHEPIGVKIQVFNERFGEESFEKLNVVTAIRNPYDRAVSLWTWLRRPGISLKPRKQYPWIDVIQKMKNFSEFVDWYVRDYESFEEMLTVNGQVPKNIQIIKFENLKEDMDSVLNHTLNLNINLTQLPHVYKTKHEHYKKYFDDAALKKLHTKEKWAFKKFYK